MTLAVFSRNNSDCCECVCAKLLQSCSTLWNSMDMVRQAPLSMGFSRQKYWSGLPCPPLGDCPNPGLEPRSPALQVDSLQSKPPEKSKNTKVGSLSLLQGIFLSQELNWCVLHCRWILYQLSYQRSPKESIGTNNSCITYLDISVILG